MRERDDLNTHGVIAPERRQSRDSGVVDRRNGFGVREAVILYWQRSIRRIYGRFFDRYDYSTHVFVFHEQKAIFIAVPKAANTSLKTALAGLLPDEIQNVVYASTRRGNRDSVDPIGREQLFRRRVRILKHQISHYPDYLKFTFVRNPWDRLVSCYADKILSSAVLEDGSRDTRHHAIHSRAGFPEKMDFEKFVKKVCHIPDKHSNRHFRSQYTFVTDRRGRIIPSFVGRFEHLHDDLCKVTEMMGAEDRALALPRIRKSDRNRYQDYYTKELRDAVAERYARDIALFNYEFS